MNPCTHFRKTEQWMNENWGVDGYEPGYWHYNTESTCVDLSIGRFRCTQCGEIGYYTGLWKKFYEEGVPCPGGENLARTVRSFPGESVQNAGFALLHAWDDVPGVRHPDQFRAYVERLREALLDSKGKNAWELKKL